MKLRKYLETRGIKKEFFAKELGISRVTLYKYMVGSSSVPKAIALAALQLTKNKVDSIKD